MRKTGPQKQTERILGFDFFIGYLSEAIERSFEGGLVAVPSAPVLCAAADDPATREALECADILLPDSGLMVALWRILSPKTELRRLSGLRYMNALVRHPRFRAQGGALWVMPSEKSRDVNLRWLNAIGLRTEMEECYLAPTYPKSGPLRDPDLEIFLQDSIKKGNGKRHIIIALGGGVQERLGLGARRRFGKRFCIHCIGGAIGFLTGDQPGVPLWADAFYLGWLVRCLADPRRFMPRYLKAARLVRLLVRHRERPLNLP